MTSFTLFIDNFHFIRPLWLFALLGLFPMLWLLKKHRFYQSPWQQFLPSHLSTVLVEGAKNSNKNLTNSNLASNTFLIKPLLIGLFTIVALAGPAWQKLPQPVYQTERGSVLIMDMSYSMYATDVKPNRLTRARFKAIDLLKKINEGDTGLIAYAGDAFVISPLTQDIKNIELLLPSLTPEIMPNAGANPLAALTLAHEMLLNAGHLTGNIYWFTDDVDNEELTDIYDWSNEFGHQLNILGIGSNSGAPITLPNGELLKDGSGAIVIPKLPSQKLKSLALRGHGNYQTITHDDSDIDKLITQDPLQNKSNKNEQQSQQTGDQWQEQGAWLLLIVLPLMLGYFRRGSVILMLPLTYLPLLFLLSLSVISPITFAAQNEEASNAEMQNSAQSLAEQPKASSLARVWNNLWQTKDQQGQQLFNQDNFKSAAKQFENSQWQGSAHYKAGNYQAALDAFKKGEQANSANSLYNQGNALAQLQQYEQAIEHYEQALKKNPDLQDAKENLEKIKQLKQQQEKQQGEQSNDQQSQDSKDQQGEQQQDQQSQDQQSQDQQSQQQSDEAQQQQNNNSSEPQDQEQTQENQQQDRSKQTDEAAKQEQQNQQAEDQAEQSDKEQQGEEKTAAQIAKEQQAKETEQKHIQLLNKVTDDPYLLLRNKMQLEYQKRKQDGASQGVKKKW